MRAAALLLASLAALPIQVAAAEETSSYAIVREDASSTSRVVSARIEKRLGAAQLKTLAEKIHAGAANPANRHTVVLFYLSGMPVNGKPWANVDMTPTPKAFVSGLTAEQAHTYATEISGREGLLGAWLTDIPSTPGRIAIFQERGKTLLEWTERGAGTSLDEVVATRGTRATRYDYKDGRDDYFMVKTSGELEIRNKDRLVAVAGRIRGGEQAPVALDDTATETTAELQPAATEQNAETAAPAELEEAKPAPHAARKRVGKRDGGRKRPPSPVFITDYMRPITQQIR